MLEADLFLDCIFLLINNNSERFQKLVRELITIYEDESRNKEGTDAELIRFYITIINALIAGGVDRDDPDALTTILIKLKTNRALAQFTDVIDLLKDAFASRKVVQEGPELQAVSRKLERIIDRIKGTVIRRRVDKANRQIFSKLQNTSGVDPQYQLEELKNIQVTLRKMVEDIDLAEEEGTATYTGVQPTGIVMFDDRNTIRTALQKRNARDCKGVIRSGMQGLNRALGEAGGLIPGESICHAALSHHGKSLMIVKWALWGVEYNPQITDEKGIPLVLFISLENEEYRNMFDIFKMKYTQIEGKPPKGMSDEDIEEWIIGYFARFGTKFVIERYADGFGIKQWRQRLNFWKSLGYNIVMACLDYLSNMDLASDDNNSSRGSRDNGLREVSFQLVNDARVWGYSFVTGHQLNREAESIAALNPVPVKKFTLKCLQDSSSIYREFDIIHFQYNEVVPSSGVKYFEGFVPKHRHVNDTPESHKFYAYAYQEKLGLPDDVGGPPQFVSDPYAVDFDAAADFSASAPVTDAF